MGGWKVVKASLNPGCFAKFVEPDSAQTPCDSKPGSSVGSSAPALLMSLT